LGCGVGANIPFFRSLNIDYFAMDGSQYAIKKIKEKYPDIKKQIAVGDFTKKIPFLTNFDLIIDRAAITHNSTKGITKSINLIYKKLKNNGKFIGIDWFSTKHSDYKKGVEIDKYTRNKIPNGTFLDVGKVHFSDKTHIQSLFSKFDIKILEHKTIKKQIPKKETFASWNLVVKKI